MSNLKAVLQKGFSNIEKFTIDDAILVIGDTGCGKSTLLSALVNGPESLEEKITYKEVPKKKKNEIVGWKTVKEKVIDYKDDVKDRVFPIGHGNKSETFFPGFQSVPNKENSYFVDIAGLKDTGGDMMEFTNQFINKKLFSSAKRLIILVPFVADSIKLARGGAVVDQLEVLMNTFQKDPQELIHSLVPIVTKVKPNDTDFDLDQFKD